MGVCVVWKARALAEFGNVDVPASCKPISVATRTSMIAGLRQMSAEQWQEFVACYEPLIRYWMRCEQVAASAEDDVFQNCLLSICTSIDGFEGLPSHRFRGWLRRIVQRRAVDAVRDAVRDRRKFRGGGLALVDGLAADPSLGSLSDRLDGERSEDEAEGGDAEPAMEACREVALRACELVKRKVKPATWEMFWQSVVEERPTAEIARELGVGQTNVRVARMRVLSRLKELAIEERDLDVRGQTPQRGRASRVGEHGGGEGHVTVGR